MSALDQHVVIATVAIDQLPPLAVPFVEPVDVTTLPIREFLAASPAHPPPLFLLLQSFRN